MSTIGEITHDARVCSARTYLVYKSVVVRASGFPEFAEPYSSINSQYGNNKWSENPKEVEDQSNGRKSKRSNHNRQMNQTLNINVREAQSNRVKALVTGSSSIDCQVRGAGRRELGVVCNRTWDSFFIYMASLKVGVEEPIK